MVKITCDSTADLDYLFEKRNIDFLPLIVTLGANSFYDGVDITPPDIFSYVKENGALPKTAARSEEDFYEFFKKYTDCGDSVIHFNISSKFSASNEMAKKAAARLNNVFVVDSYNLSTGTGLLAMHAADMAESGCSAQEIYGEIKNRIPFVQASFVVDTMEYLRKGGRISSVAAVAGEMLSIKPVVAVERGEVKLVGKAMGSKKGHNLLTQLVDRFGGIDFSMPYALGYSGLSDEFLKKYLNDSEKLWKEHTDSVPSYMIGSTIGTHVGPDAIAVAFFSNN